MPPTRRPQHLSTIEFVCLFSMITSLTAISIDALLPALKQIGTAMGHGDVGETQLVISLFIAGMMVGELLFGPVADSIGRKPTILIGLAIYAVGSLIAMNASSFEWLLIGRIVQGFGASGPKIASRALIRDQFVGDQMARITSFIFMVFILVPMLAPAAGQAVIWTSGWRMIFALYLIWALAVALWLWFRQGETLSPEHRIPIRIVPLMRNAGLILRHRRVMALTVAAGLVFGAILVFVGLAQAIFVDLYGTGERFVLWFALLAFSLGLGSFVNGKLVTRFGMQRMVHAALIVMIATSGLQLILALSMDGLPPFILFILTSFPMLGCLGLLFGNLNAMAMQWLGQLAGLGAALIASISSLVAVLVSISAAQFYEGHITPLPMTFITAALIASLLLASVARSPKNHIAPTT